MIIRRFVVFLGGCIGAYCSYWQLLRSFQLPTISLCYLGAIILWLVTEALGSLATFVALPSGRILPLPHGPSPLLARGLSEFWGRRWNLWLSEWYRQIIFRPLRKRPRVAIVAVFFVSGVLHDLVINVPLYIVTGKTYLGCMTIYFLLQPVGIWIERKTRYPAARIFLAWLFVFGAAPLMVNEGLLRVLHLWPE